MEHFSLASILSAFGFSEDLLIRREPSCTMHYLGVNLYYPDTKLFRHCLYIVQGDTIPQPLLSGFYGCILIPAAGSSYTGEYAAEAVLWPEAIDAGLLLNKIQNLYLSQSSQAHMAHMLMSSLSMNTSIGSIIHQAATIMQNAIILLDPAYKLIAMEGLGCEINDIFWHDCLSNQRVSDKHVLLIKNTGLIKDLEQSTNAALWAGRDCFNDIPRLAQKIYSSSNIYLGTIAVIQCKHEFTADDFFLLDALVDTLSSTLVDYDYLSDMQKSDSELLHFLLNQDDKPVLSPSAKRRMDEIAAHKFYLMGFIPLCHNPSLSRLGAYIQASFLDEHGCILSAIESKNVILLLCFDEFKEIQDMRQWLQNKLTPLCITIGLSPVFTDISQCASEFSLAESASKFGVTHDKDHANQIYSYHSIAYLQLLDSLPRSTIEQYLSKSPLIILHSDKYRDFYKTLRSFVRHLGSYSETAQELFIHKNTLLYRLSKIQSLTGIDYSSPHDILFLLSYFAAFEYLNGSID